MTDISDNLTTPASTPVEDKVDSPEVDNTPSPKEATVQSSSQGDNPFSSSPSTEEAEEPQPPSEGYTLKCPEHIPQEEVKAHIEAFKEAGIDAKLAQKVVDRLVARGEENEKRYVEQLGQSLEEDRSILQKEFGSDYETRERDISRYFHQENIPDEDVQALVSTWGFQKTFKFFDRYAQMNKESSAGDTFARSEGGASSIASDDIFNTPEFIEKRRSNDPEANKKIRQWALQEATLNQ
ncbi:MAG: hypothetical protein EPS19_05310 [Candidatus Liberibacter solanacearum]|uniref:hypothetical protein n=1 Tax=Candidatus Liberibacter solanacearum TaxID=556287 RepID=UPI000978EE78|nr:hypothetical protein [Candidatus Liberibacter solanacearum]ONI58591.1 hypothetical protein AYJ09_05445 [Candidatus Liberibacter solanacearum]